MWTLEIKKKLTNAQAHINIRRILNMCAYLHESLTCRAVVSG